MNEKQKEELLEIVSQQRYYVVFSDGSWRFANDQQWKLEKLWLKKPVLTHHFGGNGDKEVLMLLLDHIGEKFNDPQPAP